MNHQEIKNTFQFILDLEKTFTQGTPFADIYDVYSKSIPSHLVVPKKEFAQMLHFRGFYKKTEALTRDEKKTTHTVYYHDPELAF